MAGMVENETQAYKHAPKVTGDNQSINHFYYQAAWPIENETYIHTQANTHKHKHIKGSKKRKLKKHIIYSAQACIILQTTPASEQRWN